MYSVFKNYTNKDIIEFLARQGLKVKEERGNRVFPVTDRSVDVLECFKKRIKELNINLKFDSSVDEILCENSKVYGIKIKGTEILADKVILATGGKSYPLTGSTGDGYKLAQNLGHTITPIKPSLIPMNCYENHLCREMQGLSLRNVKIFIEDNTNKKVIYKDFGEMLFTHFGISGPIILSCSSHLVRYKNIEQKLKNKNIICHIDLKPALEVEKLNDRILRDFENLKNKQFKNSLDSLLPKKMIASIIDISGINPEKQINKITKLERQNLINIFKDFKLTLKSFRPIEEAIITSGGINVKEVNPKTMESKIIKGLYFAGEVLDVDAYTGGFNLQIAYSTGFTAGMDY